MAHVFWNAVPDAEMYDLIQGSLDQVTTKSGVLWLGPVHALATPITETSYTEDFAGGIPEIGKAFFYLVQYRGAAAASGWGTESSPWPAEITSSDVAGSGLGGGASIASGDRRRR